MCIPCVMCGACMGGDGMPTVTDDRCPSCGEPVPPDAVSCPHCYTFLYRKPASAASTAPAHVGKRDGELVGT